MQPGSGTFVEQLLANGRLGLVLTGKAAGKSHQIEDIAVGKFEIGRKMRDGPVKQARNGLLAGQFQHFRPAGFIEGGRCRQFTGNERPLPKPASQQGKKH